MLHVLLQSLVVTLLALHVMMCFHLSYALVLLLSSASLLLHVVTVAVELQTVCEQVAEVMHQIVVQGLVFHAVHTCERTNMQCEKAL